MYYGNNRMVFGKKRIRLVIWMFWAFEIVMLFQTDYYNLGTIVSGALCGLIVFTYLLETHYVKVSKENVIIFLYMLVLVGGTILTTNITSKLLQLIIYVTLYILLSSLYLTDEEKKLLENGFTLASVIYAILIICSRFVHSTAYIHSNIILFGTTLDPNYIGLPLVVAFSMLIFDFLNKKKSLLVISELFIIALAILLTASRGNFVSLLVCIIGNIVFFLKNRDIGLTRKAIILAISVLGLILFYRLASNNFNLFFERMTTFTSGGDISNGRFELWNQAIQLWSEYPIWGNGFESLGRRGGLGVHNTYIQLLCDSGLIGFSLFISFLYLLLKKSFLKDSKLFIGLLGLACHSFFLGAISSRCFWVVLIMARLFLNNGTNQNR